MTQTTTEIVSNGFAQRYTNILQTLIVISIAIAGMWGAVVLPLEQRLQRLQDERQWFIAVREYEEFRKRSDTVDATLSMRLDKTIADIDALRIGLVSKELHMALRAEVESLKQLFGGQYTIADKVKDLQHQIEQMRIATDGDRLKVNNK